MTDWIITLPKNIEWSDYEKELAFVENWEGVLNYRVPFKPKAQPGDRCFVTWQGIIRGYMEIVGIEYFPDGFTCETTGIYWRSGWYIQRSGPFYGVTGPGLEYSGFRGIRRLDIGICNDK